MNNLQCRQPFDAWFPFQKCGNTWLEDWRELFRVQDLFPDFHQDIPEQFNCISRIIIFLILLLILFKGMNAYVGILFGLLIGMIILYFVLYKKIMLSPVKEGFRRECFPQQDMIVYDSTKPQEVIEISGRNNNPTLVDVKSAHFWCKPDTPLGDKTASLNQSLVGGANPKTKIMPVIPPPIYDFDTWTPNDFIVPYKINEYGRQELYQNGYMSWDDQKPIKDASKQLFDTYACVRTPFMNDNRMDPSKKPTPEIKENFAPPVYNNQDYNIAPTRLSFTEETMDLGCGGYNPENTKYNYPVNLPPTNCMASPQMSEYNKNLFTIPLQPGVATRSQVNQPDASMSNLGISFTQPRLPYACEMDDRGNMMFTEYDPNQYPSEYLLRGRDNFGRDSIPRNEIYDPRLTGYGTSYRSYIDPMTGQPRFYYDDIDAHTQYNFISKNNIDHTLFAPNTGPYPGLPPEDSRTLANMNFTNDTLKRRTELQYNLMRKNSHREWQRRTAPIMNSGYGPAGCGPQSVDSYAGPRGTGEYNYYW